MFKNARVFDGASVECRTEQQVLVEGGRIPEVSDKPIPVAQAEVIDVFGRTLIPGLIDAHMHAYGSNLNVQKVDLAGTPYRTAYAAQMLGHLLDCGFTTVRDIDHSLARAITEKPPAGTAYCGPAKSAALRCAVHVASQIVR